MDEITIGHGSAPCAAGGPDPGPDNPAKHEQLFLGSPPGPTHLPSPLYCAALFAWPPAAALVALPSLLGPGSAAALRLAHMSLTKRSVPVRDGSRGTGRQAV